MKTKTKSRSVALAALLVTSVPALAAEQYPASPVDGKPATMAVAQPDFAAPEEAAKALTDAIRAEDPQALAALIGPDSEEWIFTGDNVLDRVDWISFLEAWDKRHAVVKVDDAMAIMTVGEDEWPFSAPIVKRGGRWLFDGEAGRVEMTRRRVGRNELDTIQTLLAITDAQLEYASIDIDGNGFHEYAGRFISTPGARDGLYWPIEAGEAPSPLGPLIGEAAREGYEAPSDEPQPYHGYRYRMLTEQGQNAPGGAYSYLVDGRLIGGFAVVAYPARYNVSGIMTLMVNHMGRVYQKDLGDDTDTIVAEFDSFNPDESWTEVK